jgi:hypothetical protein
MNMSYEGVGTIPGCTPDQQNSIETLLTLAPGQRHDGLRKQIATLLGGNPPFTDSAVMAATQTALVEGSGVPIPRALFVGAQADTADTKRRVPRHT